MTSVHHSMHPSSEHVAFQNVKLPNSSLAAALRRFSYGIRLATRPNQLSCWRQNASAVQVYCAATGLGLQKLQIGHGGNLSVAWWVIGSGHRAARFSRSITKASYAFYTLALSGLYVDSRAIEQGERRTCWQYRRKPFTVLYESLNFVIRTRKF